MKFGVSVIIPMYNAEPFVREAIKSIQSQCWHDLEVIVVDDGSEDNGLNEIPSTEFPITVIQQLRQGPAAARNCAIQVATKEFISFLDADDLWPRNRLQILSRYVSIGTQIILGRWRSFRSTGKDLVFDNPAHCFALGNSLIRSEVFKRVGLLDTSLGFSEDVDWFLRARDLGSSLQIIDDVLLLHRRHGGNMTEDMTVRASGILSVLAASIRRRREGDLHEPELHHS